MISVADSRRTDSLQEFFRELSQILIGAGVSLKAAQGALQAAYVEAAQEKAKLGNARVNQSAVAAITGLNRTRVRSILRQRAPARSNGDRFSAFVETWTKDPEFASRSGKPRSLVLRGKAKSFESLVNRCGGDVTPQALLRELARLGVVRVSQNRVTLTRTSMASQRQRSLNLLVLALAKALESPTNSAHSTGVVVHSASVLVERPSPKGRAIFRDRSVQGLYAYLADLETAAAAVSQVQRPRHSRSRKMSKLSVLLIDRQ
jgi:hypothetical protein